MLGAYAQSCCCGGSLGCEKDGIWQSEIESGCCHQDDTLLLWCERPAYSQKTNSICLHQSAGGPFGGGNEWQEVCCTTAYASQPAIQAIYHYEECYFRCIPVGLVGIYEFGVPEMCPPGGCDLDPNGNPTACAPYMDTGCNTVPCGMAIQSGCCNDPSFNAQPWSKNCLACCDTCNDPGMSDWRRERASCNDQWKWIVEAACHKNGANLGSGGDCDGLSSYSNCARLGSIANGNGQMICVVHHERWWKIAESCATGVRIYVPQCLQAGGTVDCGGNVCQTDDLVPRWWIFASSGIPLYAGDLIDAIRFGVIDGSEALQLISDVFGNCTHPNQVTLKKLASGGYLRTNDWRDEQRMAYQELHTRFPTAGYGAHIQNVSSMHTLGPFRKRMTYKTIGTSNQPLLRKSDVVNNPNLSPLQADGFISFPGGTQDDYDYWCARQWVYFRGRPGGWQWAGWGANVCPGDEVTSILLGDGRSATNCIDAFMGGGCRNPPTKTVCSQCNGGDIEGVPVNFVGCGQQDCALPIPDCGPPDVCKALSVQPYCQGLRFKYTLHGGNTQLVAPSGSPCNPGPGCGQCVQINCVMTQYSFLTEAKRSKDSWLDSIPYTCRNEKPPLPVFNEYETWSKSHRAPQSALCNLATDPSTDSYSWCHGCGCQLDGDPPCPPELYTSRMCCGGGCVNLTCDCDPCNVDPYHGPHAASCSAASNCPPHSTGPQISCIGFTPSCSAPI